MKKLIILITWITASGVNGQQRPVSPFNNADSTTVTGKIDGYKTDQPEQFINYHTYDITGRQQKHLAPIQPGGKFSFRFMQLYEGDFAISYGANFTTLYAQPGEKIEIKIDNNVADKEYHFPGAFKISGTSAAVSTHMLQFFAMYLPMMQERAPSVDIKLPTPEFAALTHKNLAIDLNLLDKYVKKYDPPAKFINWTRNWLTYEAANMIIMQPFLGRNAQVTTRDQLYGYLKDIKVVNERAMNNASYYQFITTLTGDIQMMIGNGSRNDMLTTATQVLDEIDRKMNGITRELAYYNCYAWNARSELTVSKMDPAWERFDTIIHDDLIQHLLEDKRNAGLRSFEKYNVFERIKKFSPQLRNDLLTILEKEKGHYVFIDFWGSWCAPCRVEMPGYKSFIEELKDQPISFLFLSVETTEKDMQETQKKYSIPATFINLDKNATDIANEVFRFSSYPSHFILDPDGNVITGNIRSLSKQDAIAFIRTLIKK